MQAPWKKASIRIKGPLDLKETKRDADKKTFFRSLEALSQVVRRKLRPVWSKVLDNDADTCCA